MMMYVNCKFNYVKSHLRIFIVVGKTNHTVVNVVCETSTCLFDGPQYKVAISFIKVSEEFRFNWHLKDKLLEIGRRKLDKSICNRIKILDFPDPKPVTCSDSFVENL